MEQEMIEGFELVQTADLRLIEGDLAARIKHMPRHASLTAAMEYSLLGGGKRIRPILTLAVCRMCGGRAEAALPFACAVEMIHTYSLIHDDLPAMDNSDLRRGRPTNHKQFDQATAILAGDGLLTLAFEVLTQAQLSPRQIAEGVAVLAKAAGPEGMVAGQALDLAGENAVLTLPQLELLQSLKTGALIAAAAELGCIAADTDEKTREKVCAFAAKLGRAFQVRDDMLDVTGNVTQVGKPVGHDTRKNTFVSALGLDACQSLLHQLTQAAAAALEGLEGAEYLLALANHLEKRMK